MPERHGIRPPKPPGGGHGKGRGARRGGAPDLSAWLRRRLAGFGDRLFSSQDALARQNGWQVTPGRLGLSRTYRDQRFGPPASPARNRGDGEHAVPATSGCT
jgi:hypothetical protein